MSKIKLAWEADQDKAWDLLQAANAATALADRTHNKKDHYLASKAHQAAAKSPYVAQTGRSWAAYNRAMAEKHFKRSLG